MRSNSRSGVSHGNGRPTGQQGPCAPPWHSLCQHRKSLSSVEICLFLQVGEDPPSRKPGEVTLTLTEDATPQTLKQELKEQFGSWRCDIRVEEDIIRVASNTDTT